MANFVYYNRNPNGNKQNDCVTRAISLASNLPYPIIRKKLFHTAKLLNCEKLCVCCYRHLIEDVLKYKPIKAEGYIVNNFANLNPKGIYLLRINGHITTLIDNSIYDIWDCRNELITDAWKIQ